MISPRFRSSPAHRAAKVRAARARFAEEWNQPHAEPASVWKVATKRAPWPVGTLAVLWSIVRLAPHLPPVHFETAGFGGAKGLGAFTDAAASNHYVQSVTHFIPAFFVGCLAARLAECLVYALSLRDLEQECADML